MKHRMRWTGTTAILAAIVTIIGAAVLDAGASGRFSGGSSDGYGQCEAQWITQFTSGSRFKGGSFDGYYAVTVQAGMLLPPPKGTAVVFR
jgi:hypothetical protein